MVNIARKNLLHDPVKFLITLLGVTFSVTLIATQVGMYLGFMRNSSMLVDNTPADIWITSKNSRNFDFSLPFKKRMIYRVRGMKGVAWADTMMLTWGVMKARDGGTEQVEIVGFNPNTGIGGPWAMQTGRFGDLKGGRFFTVDASSAGRLGENRIGDYRDLMSSRWKVEGVTRDVQSITTAPFLFMSLKNAQTLNPDFAGEDTTSFILARVDQGEDPVEVAGRLRKILSDQDVYTREEFSARSRRYWTISTGMGFGFLFTVLMGFLVGLVVVSQTIYAATMQHLREFGILKAIGGTNRDIYRIIIEQALINALLGYAAGALLALGARALAIRYDLPLMMPNGLLVGLFVLTVLMCLIASILSIHKATRVDPVMVFRA